MIEIFTYIEIEFCFRYLTKGLIIRSELKFDLK